LPNNVNDVMVGVAARSDGLSFGGKYSIGDTVAVTGQGTIFVELEENMDTDASVYVRYDGKAQVQTITFDADLVTSNTIDLKIGGVAMTQVTFATSHDDTMDAIAAQILADFPQIATAVKGGADNRVLTITAAVKGTDFVISDVVVAAGSSQAGSVVAETVSSVALSERGKIRNDADSTTAVLLANAKLLKNGEAGKVVPVIINLP
jgi:hypothetical protein